MSNYLEKYPNSGYEVAELPSGMLRVACPDHGDFEISPTNFAYHRGCSLCKGIHPRAYPIGASSNWPGHPVYVNPNPDGTVEISDQSVNHVYAISYSDKRVAAAVINIATDLIELGQFVEARKFMNDAASFKPKIGEGVKGALLRAVLPDHALNLRSLQAKIDDKYPASGYTFDPSEYKGSKENITITCPEHGAFVTTWDNFMHNRGCPECKGKHHRAYPRGSDRTARSRVVFVYRDDNGTIKLGDMTADINKSILAVRLKDAKTADVLHHCLKIIASDQGTFTESDFIVVKKLMNGFMKK